MAKKGLKGNSSIRRFTKDGLAFIIVAAITLEATSLVQYIFARKGIREEATMRAQSQMEAANLKIKNVIDGTETAVRGSEWIAAWTLEQPDSMIAVTRRLVNDNSIIVGSTIAVVPGYLKDRRQYAPYSLQLPGSDKIEEKSLATEEYDYPRSEWFTMPIRLQAGYWSEPYVDVGGGDILMTTFSLPIKDMKGKIAAVLTADISLDWLNSLIGNLKVYPSAFGMLVSRGGKVMAGKENDSEELKSLRKDMSSGENGQLTIDLGGEENLVYYAPVDKTGWSMAVVIPEKEVYGSFRQISFIVKILQIFGIIMLFLLLRYTAKRQAKMREISEKKERMEGELQIGRDIQMSMIPKTFPPFPERHDIDMSASIVPAKEVGGDLYDFYIRDEKLYFCIGDVSGKGVPASLVMAVTRSLFRTVSSHEKSPQRIVTTMNNSMADMNESNMFVTFFIGILDLKNGHLRYCNAGHNAPYILSDTLAKLPVLPNLPLGVMPGMAFQEQEADLKYDDALFLYTDGLTEAENANHELFGEARTEKALHGRMSAQDKLESIKTAVADYVGDAPQSDDLTMLFIHYVNDAKPDMTEKHLALHNDIKQISLLSEFIDNIAEEQKLDSSLAMSINLALEEAATNVIMYAYPKGTEGAVDLDAIIRPDSLQFVLTDSGKAFDPTAAPVADISLDVKDRPIGGLGIYLVRNIMDQVYYERKDGKNVLTMIKQI